jgi:hypothetical protein
MGHCDVAGKSLVSSASTNSPPRRVGSADGGHAIGLGFLKPAVPQIDFSVGRYKF